MTQDRFGNPYANPDLATPEVPSLRLLEDDKEVESRVTHIFGDEDLHLDLTQFTLEWIGEKLLQLDEVDMSIMDDEIASAVFSEEIKKHALTHLEAIQMNMTFSF